MAMLVISRWYINDIHNGGTFIEHLYHGELLNNQVGYVTWSSHTGIPMQSEINNYCNWLKKNHCEWIDDHPPIWMYNIYFFTMAHMEIVKTISDGLQVYHGDFC